MTELDDLAAQMRIVDLGDRVRRAHRRGVRRRFVVGGVLTVAAALVAALVIWLPVTDRAQPPAAELPGTLVTVRDDGGRLVVRAGDRELARLPADAVDLALSPNGDRLAWRQPEGYYTAELPGGEPRPVAETDSACLRPVWAPDGEPLLLVPDSAGGIAWYDVEAAATVAELDTDRERSASMCDLYPVSGSGDGYDLYYGTAPGFELRYLSAEGKFTDTGVMKRLRAEGDWEVLTGVSSDGSTACVGSAAGEGRCDALIDLESGELLDTLDAAAVWFCADGRLLTVDDEGRLTLRRHDGTVIERGRAPEGAVVLAYFSR